MANREIEARLLLSAVDKTGKAFRSVSKNLDGVNRQAAAYNRQQRGVGRTALAVGRAAAVASAAVAAAGVASYKEFANSERTLTRIGITAEATREEMASVRKSLFETAELSGLQFDDMVLGLDALVASGRTLQEAMALLPSVAVTAQASGAEMVDIATSADALFTSLNIGAENMQGAFDILVAGGKAGKFELKDMAQYLPSLAPAFKALGYEGEEGLQMLIAALQTVRTQTGSSGEAATAFMDILTKMESETVNNNFKKFGVDLRGSMDKARESGEDVLDALVRISREALDGDLSKLPRLFTDKQMLIGMRALMTSADDMERFKAALKDVDGSALKDLGVLMEDQQAKIDGMARAWDRASSSFGAYIAPFVSGALDGATGFFERDQAIQRGMDADGIGFFEKLYKQVRYGQDSDEAKRWAAMGGESLESVYGPDAKGFRGYVPTRRPVIAADADLGSMPATGIPVVPTSRPSIGRHNQPIIVPQQVIEEISASEKYYARHGVSRQPGNLEIPKPEIGPIDLNEDPIELEVDANTNAAEGAVDTFRRNAEQRVVIEVDADTSKADAKMRALEKRRAALNQSLGFSGPGSSSTARNLGRTMPDAGKQ